MTPGLLAMLGCLAALSGTVMEVLRQRIIVPAIKEQSSYSVGVSVFTLYTEAREYRDHCRQKRVSLRWWRLWWGAHVVFITALAALAVTWGLSMSGL